MTDMERSAFFEALARKAARRESNGRDLANEVYERAQIPTELAKEETLYKALGKGMWTGQDYMHVLHIIRNENFYDFLPLLFSRAAAAARGDEIKPHLDHNPELYSLARETTDIYKTRTNQRGGD